MNNKQQQNVITDYLDATVGRFYSDEQRERLLLLFYLANGFEPAGFKKLKDLLALEQNGETDTIVQCNNYLMFNSDRKGSGQALLNAFVDYKSERLNELLRDKQYDTKARWITEIYRDKNSFEHFYDLSLLAYISNDLSEAKRRWAKLAKANFIPAIKLHAYFAEAEGNIKEARRAYGKLRGLAFRLLEEGYEWLEDRLSGESLPTFPEEELKFFDGPNFLGDSVGIGFACNNNN